MILLPRVTHRLGAFSNTGPLLDKPVNSRSFDTRKASPLVPHSVTFILPSVLEILKTEFGGNLCGAGSSSPLVWEYFFQLGRKKSLFDECTEKASLDNKSVDVNELFKDKESATLFASFSRNYLTNSEFDTVSWNRRYHHEFDLATLIFSCISRIHDTLHILSEDSTDESQREDLDAMVTEDVSLTIQRLREADCIQHMTHLIHKRVDESDEWSKTAETWTLETLGRAGGIESGIFARDLLDTYIKYFTGALKWDVEDLTDPGDHGGKLRLRQSSRDDATFNIYQVLKHEVGTHRVQRVPVTDPEGKMQTSTASVFLMPQPSAVSVDIDEADCKFDFVRGGGPGGQGMQSSSNCCVMTHTPTGISMKVHQARSAAANKQLALDMLAQRLWREKNAANERYQDSLFAKQWSSGERGEKIRTYNYPQGRVTEHRLGKDFPLATFMDGGESILSMSSQLIEKDRQQQLGGVLARHISAKFPSD